jgi:hypothetical protein
VRAERIARALLAGAFCVTLWSQLTALAPSRGAAPMFNSDSAIPVLMANDGQWDAFRLYFYGQDRFGAWPFWIAQLGRPVWTPDSLHVWQTLWLFSGVIAAALLSRRRPIVGGAAFLLAIALPGLVRQMVSDLAQPYAWQLPALLWGWLALRAWVGRTWRSWRGTVAAAAVQFLAIWISTLSVPLLAALALLELWRVRPRESRPWRAAARGLIPVALATGAEGAMRAVYHQTALANFNYAFVTHLRLDWGHLAGNLGAVSQRLLAPDCWPVLIAATVGALLGLRRRADPQLGTLALGFTALALLPIPVLVCVSHVRENLFNERFFTPTICFAEAGAVVAAVLALEAFLPKVRAELPLAAGALFSLFVLRPLSSANPEFERMSKIAAALVERAPGSPLINGYWNSYLYSALVRPGALTALPAEDEYGRTPFDLEKLRTARTVIVGNAGSLAKFAGAAMLTQYGVPLHLLRPLYSDGPDTFALYENAIPDLRPRGGHQSFDVPRRPVDR